MQRYTKPPGEGWRPGEGSVVLRGRPPYAVGHVLLVNEGDEHVRVRSLGARAREGHRLRVDALRVAGRIAPRASARVRASVRLDPHTPPGRYELEAEGFGERPVVVDVLERVAVTLRPQRLTLRGAPGETLDADLTVVNRGNVPLHVPKAALAHLEERDWIGRALVFALRESSPDEGHQQYLDRVLRELKGSDIRPVRIEVKSESEELEPGEAHELHLSLSLPEDLRKGRTYVRSIELMHSRLFIEIECDGAANSTKRRAR